MFGWSSESTVWSGSAVTLNGMLASAPGAIGPVNFTVNPVTVLLGSGSGSVSGEPAVRVSLVPSE